MNPKNAAELLAQPDIDGGLIGGASLKPEQFVEIVNAANQEYFFEGEQTPPRLPSCRPVKRRTMVHSAASETRRCAFDGYGSAKGGPDLYKGLCEMRFL